jgi:transcriptional regulator with XRE-family HTH domain
MKKITSKNFTPLSTVITRKLKDNKFKAVYSEEMSRLQLAYDIKSLRQKRGMTQGQVALKAKMSQSVIARIESGSRGFSIATLYKIARVFNCEISLISSRHNFGARGNISPVFSDVDEAIKYLKSR